MPSEYGSSSPENYSCPSPIRHQWKTCARPSKQQLHKSKLSNNSHKLKHKYRRNNNPMHRLHHSLQVLLPPNPLYPTTPLRHPRPNLSKLNFPPVELLKNRENSLTTVKKRKPSVKQQNDKPRP